MLFFPSKTKNAFTYRFRMALESWHRLRGVRGLLQATVEGERQSTGLRTREAVDGEDVGHRGPRVGADPRLYPARPAACDECHDREPIGPRNGGGFHATSITPREGRGDGIEGFAATERGRITAS